MTLDKYNSSFIQWLNINGQITIVLNKLNLYNVINSTLLFRRCIPTFKQVFQAFGKLAIIEDYNN